MKKCFLRIAVCVLFVVIISGCVPSYIEAKPENPESEKEDDYFTTIITWEENGTVYNLKYANNTKVVYIEVTGGYRYGITAVLNPDGTPQLYDENFRY